MSVKFLFFSILLAFFLAKGLASNPDTTSFLINYQSGQKIRITEKTNLRRYTNSRFDGLLSKEVSGVITIVRDRPESFTAEGEFSKLAYGGEITGEGEEAELTVTGRGPFKRGEIREEYAGLLIRAIYKGIKLKTIDQVI